MFKLAFTQSLFDIRTKWKINKIQFIVPICFIVLFGIFNTRLDDTSNMTWFWCVYWVMLLCFQLYELDENMFPQVFHYLPITADKKRKYLFYRVCQENIMHVVLIIVMYVYYYLMKGTYNLSVWILLMALTILSIMRLKQKLIRAFAIITGKKHIYDNFPEKRSVKTQYWFLTITDWVAFIIILFYGISAMDGDYVIFNWIVYVLVFLYCVISLTLNSRMIRKCMDRIEW